MSNHLRSCPKHRKPLPCPHCNEPRVLYTIEPGGVGRVDEKLNEKNQDAEKARQQDIDLAQAEQRAQWRAASEKYDAKKRDESLTEKLLALVKLTHPNTSERKRALIVEDILKEENRPTAWEVNRIIKEMSEDGEGQMYASALTNPDGTKVSVRPAEESHRNPIYTGFDDSHRREARESVFDGDAPGKHQDENAIALINRWRNEINAVVDGVRKSAGVDADLSTYGYEYMGVSMRLSDWLKLLELFPQDDEGEARRMIYVVLSGVNKEDSETVPAYERGRRKRVTPKGQGAKDDEEGGKGVVSSNDSGEWMRTTVHKKKSAPLPVGSLGEEPKETKQGSKMRRLGKKILAQEELRHEVEEFNRTRRMRKSSEASKSEEAA